jgi:cardiolipin synthase
LLKLKRPVPRPAPRPHAERHHKVFSILALIALAIQSGLLFLALFEPPLPYVIPNRSAGDNRSENYRRTLAALTHAELTSRNSVQVLTNGEVYYKAELDAIRAARRNINLEAYIFEDGDIVRSVVDALVERATAGVHVKLLIDSIGSTLSSGDKFKRLRQAGGRVAWYHPVRWYSWPRINNRTHRELTIIDGKTAFLGGAGWADHWLLSKKNDPRWRDTMVRVDGEAVTGLQSTFAENWLESAGEVLIGAEYFPFPTSDQNCIAMPIASSPTTGRSTPARILFQSLFASAKTSIHLTSPYFLPDRSLRDQLITAVKHRKVEVKIIVPGKRSDHLLTRRSSRRLYGPLLEAGASIYEYRPSMIHVKSLIIDGTWAVVGSTNMDSRSFGLNDEVNLAIYDASVANRLDQDFSRDLSQSHQVSYQEWKNRSIFERFNEWFGALLQRQQ